MYVRGFGFSPMNKLPTSNIQVRKVENFNEENLWELNSSILHILKIHTMV